MNRLILLRHAQSEHHVKGLTGGWTDTPLTELGHQQAQLLAVRCQQLFAEEPSLSLYSSDLVRASQTAEHVATALGKDCQLEPGLREINNGVAVNLTWEAAKQIELPLTEPRADWVPYAGAESWHQMTERVFTTMDRIALSPSSTVAVVTHGGTGIAIIQWWLGLKDAHRQGISFALDPTSISEMGFNYLQERTLIRLNDTGHLK